MISIKQVLILVLPILLLFVLLLTNTSSELTSNEYLRIHIRANSNDSQDQNIKYEIKDTIVKELTPLLSVAKDKSDAINIINNNIDYIEQVCDDILKQNNFEYVSEAKVTSEVFPTRTYDDLTLESGTYDSLIINLGSGTGDNWWCVAYPPLCFVGGSDSSETIYTSKIVEFFRNIFGG